MSKAEDIIQQLQLTKHPEGGYFKEVYRSKESIQANHLPERFKGSRNFGTAIYFLLKRNEISAFHKINQDEIWHYYDGSSLIMHTIDEQGKYGKHIIGKDIDKGECPQLVIPSNVWMAAEIEDKSSFVLVGCTTAPGFDFKDFELAEAKQLLDLFPQHKELIFKFTNTDY